MKKAKEKYNVYLVSEQDNFFAGRFDRTVEKIGETYAVSKAQAISTFCFRKGLQRFFEIEVADVVNRDYITAEPALNEWRRKFGEQTVDSIPEEVHMSYEEMEN